MRSAILYDKSPISRAHLVSLLEEEGYDVEVALSVDDLEGKIRTCRCDLIVLEAWLDHLQRVDIVAEVRRVHANCPIVFISDKKMFSWVHDALRLGAVDFFLKPVKPREFSERIQAIQDSILAGQVTQQNVQAFDPPENTSYEESPAFDASPMPYDLTPPPFDYTPLPFDVSPASPDVSPPPGAPPPYDTIPPWDTVPPYLAPSYDSSPPWEVPPPVFELDPDQFVIDRDFVEELLHFLNTCLTTLLDMTRRAGILNDISASSPNSNTSRKKVVLLVSPQVEVVEKLSKAVEQYSMVVKQVYTGGEALDSIGRDHIDILIIERNLPDLDGYMIGQSLPEQFPNMQVAVMDAYGTSEGTAEVLGQVVEENITIAIPSFNSLVSLMKELDSRRVQVQDERKLVAAFTQCHKEFLQYFAEIKKQLTLLIK